MQLFSQSKFAVFQREMVSHLDEEESEVVPAMRRTFTQQEEQKVRCLPHSHALVFHHGKVHLASSGPSFRLSRARAPCRAHRVNFVATRS